MPAYTRWRLSRCAHAVQNKKQELTPRVQRAISAAVELGVSVRIRRSCHPPPPPCVAAIQLLCGGPLAGLLRKGAHIRVGGTAFE